MPVWVPVECDQETLEPDTIAVAAMALEAALLQLRLVNNDPGSDDGCQKDHRAC
jgi:hypothetical protein